MDADESKRLRLYRPGLIALMERAGKPRPSEDQLLAGMKVLERLGGHRCLDYEGYAPVVEAMS
jgi:hypothetical protein